MWMWRDQRMRECVRKHMCYSENQAAQQNFSVRPSLFIRSTLFQKADKIVNAARRIVNAAMERHSDRAKPDGIIMITESRHCQSYLPRSRWISLADMTVVYQVVPKKGFFPLCLRGRDQGPSREQLGVCTNWSLSGQKQSVVTTIRIVAIH